MTEGLYRVNSIVRLFVRVQTTAMRVPSPLLAIALLAACAPLSTYYKPGVSVARLNTDETACEVSSLRDAPVANQLRQRPPVFVPGGRICNAAGVCYQRPGHWVSGGYYTVDVNQGLRVRLMDMCMARKGYQPVSIPRCNPGVANAATPGVTRVLPKLNEKSCAILNQDGSWQIVNTQ